MKWDHKAYWIIFIPFCTAATLSVYKQGAFNGMDSIGLLILGASYLLVGVAIRAYIKSNAEKIKKWFQE